MENRDPVKRNPSQQECGTARRQETLATALGAGNGEQDSLPAGEWSTPQWFFDELDREFHFTLDAAAQPWNAKCNNFFTPEDDGLRQSWRPHKEVFLNPPFDADYGLWVQKAWRESRTETTVVMVAPFWKGYEWFQFCTDHAEMRLVKGKTYFKNRGKGTGQDVVVFVFRPDQTEGTLGPWIVNPKRRTNGKATPQEGSPAKEVAACESNNAKPADVFRLSDFPDRKEVALDLSELDLQLLAGIEDRAKTMRTRVKGVALGYHHGLFIYGPGGEGKSHIVEDELNHVLGEGEWRHYNARMTQAGLFGELKTHSDKTHLLEDMERDIKDPTTQGFLRAAMARPNQGERIITSTKFDRQVEFEFTGGIIILSNDRIDQRYGRLGALASRTSPIFWSLSLPEKAALMRQIALNGYSVDGVAKLTPEECMEVAEYLISEMEDRSDDTKIDLRTYCEGALLDRLQAKDENSPAGWKKAVQSRIQGKPIPETRSDRLTRQQQLACCIHFGGGSGEEQCQMWEKKTGLKKTAYYDRLKEAKASGLFAQYEGRAV